ncbi:transmembrane protein, putative [Medicago truncatula]|uniref:Transmembrane protein, putative n=1 Tax=Medicago truncatula TaxID=3880 RepID=G7I8M5_MEDTR|nr:transmembrane protein, putative [Medicago truncatula]
MSSLHGDINNLFLACGSSSPSPLFARIFRRRPWISSPPVAFLTWLDLFWLLLLTVVDLVLGSGLFVLVLCFGTRSWLFRFRRLQLHDTSRYVTLHGQENTNQENQENINQTHEATRPPTPTTTNSMNNNNNYDPYDSPRSECKMKED